MKPKQNLKKKIETAVSVVPFVVVVAACETKQHFLFFLLKSLNHPPPPSFSSLSCILEQKMAVISGLEVVDVGSCMWRIQAKEREIERERRR